MSQKSAHIMYASNLAEMQQAANTFLKLFPNGGHFAVYGEMGAGKTTFIHCVCKALNLPFAGSPTFSLVNEYVLPNGHKMYHFDLYRLNSAEELRTIGFEEYIESGYYIFIEWPQIASAFTKKMHGLTITDNHELRTIEL